MQIIDATVCRTWRLAGPLQNNTYGSRLRTHSLFLPFNNLHISTSREGLCGGVSEDECHRRSVHTGWPSSLGRDRWKCRTGLRHIRELLHSDGSYSLKHEFDEHSDEQWISEQKAYCRKHNLHLEDRMFAQSISTNYVNNNLKVSIAFANYLGPEISFYYIKSKHQALSFLDSKRKSVERP